MIAAVIATAPPTRQGFSLSMIQPPFVKASGLPEIGLG